MSIMFAILVAVAFFFAGLNIGVMISRGVTSPIITGMYSFVRHSSMECYNSTCVCGLHEFLSEHDERIKTAVRECCR